MIHTRPNLMRNVGCCYGNSICWNFSLLASFWHYILKKHMKRCGGCEDKREVRTMGLSHLSFSKRERTCRHTVMPPLCGQSTGSGGVILRFRWNPGVYLFLTSVENWQCQGFEQNDSVRKDALTKLKDEKALTPERIICFVVVVVVVVVLFCFIFSRGLIY